VGAFLCFSITLYYRNSESVRGLQVANRCLLETMNKKGFRNNPLREMKIKLIRSQVRLGFKGRVTITSWITLSCRRPHDTPNATSHTEPNSYRTKLTPNSHSIKLIKHYVVNYPPTTIADEMAGITQRPSIAKSKTMPSIMAKTTLLPNNHTASTILRISKLNYGDSVVLGATPPGQKPGERNSFFDTETIEQEPLLV